MLPHIISATGAAVSADEIAAVQRVICTRRHQDVGIYRVTDQLTGVLVEYHPYKNTAYTTPGGAVDYVAMAMPNPIPYRGVSIGVVNRGVPTLTLSQTTYQSGVDHGNPLYHTDQSWTIKNSSGAVVGIGSGTLDDLANLNFTQPYPTGSIVQTEQWNSYYMSQAMAVSFASSLGLPAPPLNSWVAFTGGVWYKVTSPTYSMLDHASGSWSAVSPSYESLLAADIAAGTGGTWTYIMASDGQVLASEVQNTVTIGGVQHTLYIPVTQYSGGYWNGGSNVWMMDSAYVAGVPPFNHKLTFTVPEDCIYPVPGSVALNAIGAPLNPSTSALDSDWNADWAAGVAAFNLRRKLWFKKNSDTFIASLKSGAILPASWDYQIKSQIGKKYNSFTLADGSHPGRHTKMPIVMSITSAPDVVVSDTSAGLTQAGTMVTRRTTTFAYTDANGKAWSVPIDGTLTQMVTMYGAGGDFAILSTYLNWYDQSNLAKTVPFFMDRVPSIGLGQLWTGTINTGKYANLYPDSTWGSPGNPLPYQTSQYIPPFPAYSNTLVGTAPDIFLQYHNTVIPQYVKDTTQSSTVMNNSAMYQVTEVHISPIGLIANGAGFSPAGTPVGMFSTGEDGTQVEIYGTAIYKFDWTTGSLTFKSWKPLHDANGNVVASKVVNLPAGTLWSLSPNNCLITYKGMQWPDVKEYVKARDKDAKSGLFDFADPVSYALNTAIKAG